MSLGPQSLSGRRASPYTRHVRTTSWLAAAFCLGLLAAPLRAADPALVASMEKYLSDEEKSILAAVLIDPRAGAEFDADARQALSDSKALKLFVDKWRGKLEAFAEADGKHADPNLEGTYRNYAEMLTPQMRAYLAKRVPLMPEDARNELIGYLKDINKSLADDGHLSWYTKKVVAGVMDRYRQQLNEYAATPLAQQGKRNAPAAAVALAQLQAESTRLAQAEKDRIERERLASAKPVTPPAAKPTSKPTTKPEAKPEPKPKAPPTEVASGPATGGTMIPADPATGARGQAGNAVQDGGRTFDGGGVTPGSTPGPVVVGPGAGGSKPPALSPSAPGGTPSLVGSVPSPTTAEDDFMSKIEGQQTKAAATPLHKHLPTIAGGLLLGLVGFLLGGPAGAAVGLAVGAVAGHLIGKALLD